MFNFYKRIFATLLILINFVYAKADITVSSKITEVMVYQQFAQITANADVNIVPGNYNLIVDNLSQYTDEGSLQLKGDANFVILSISTQMNYLGEEKKSRQLIALEDSIDRLTLKISANNSQIEVYTAEHDMIIANQKISGANNGVNSLELEKMANFYRQRLLEIKTKRSDLQRKQQEMAKKQLALTNQLNQLRAEQTSVYLQAIISIQSSVTAKTKLSLNYIVSNAGWSPIYDIKSESVNAPLKIVSKANVYQNTGDLWKEVKMSISTGNPSLNNTKPNLQPYYLSIYNPVTNYNNNNYRNRNAGVPAAMPQMMMEDREDAKSSKMEEKVVTNSSAYSTNIESTTSNVFEISLPYTIPSDGKEYVVAIQTYDVPAVYSYYSTPKLEKEVFLIATITNWEQTGLLPGEANLFNEGTYVGKSYFDTKITGDTLPISLGRDKNININRKKTKNFTEKNFTGNTKKTSLEYEIEIKNKKKGEIDLVIEDQYPLSKIEEVEVDLFNDGGATVNKETGKLRWNFKLKAAENKTLKFGYNVKYPKKIILNNL
ncbi:MAG: mucoidy inhibitor MuiA family protein [Bacteroidota bacterium]